MVKAVAIRSRQGAWYVARQRGAAMVEFVVVAPILTALGLAIIQYAMLFFAKSQINYAAFMSARAGSVAHANISTVRNAYVKALIPLYGGGQSTTELAASYAKAVADLTDVNLRVELLSPTKESFDDWATDERLNTQYGARAIPNTSLALKPNPDNVGAASGQSLQDANMIKVRITHGYAPKVWLIGMIYTTYLSWMDTGNDAFASNVIANGRIPVVSHVTLEMHSDPVENGNVSNPGAGNNGSPSNPGDPPETSDPPPACWTIGCTVPPTPNDPGGNGSKGGNGGNNGKGGGNTGGGCTGANCPTCN